MSAPVSIVNLKPRASNRKRKPRRGKSKPTVVVVEPEAPLPPQKPLAKPRRRNRALPSIRSAGKMSINQQARRSRLTADGRNFIFKYINPCHNDGRHCAGVPLAVSEETVVFGSRVENAVSAPPDLVALWTSGASAFDWYLGLFVPPWIDDCVFLLASGVQVTNFSALSKLISSAREYPDWQSSTTTPNLKTSVWFSKISSPMVKSRLDTTTAVHQDFSNFRVVGRGITTELIADGLTNRGRVTSSQWNAPYSPITVVKTAIVNGTRVVTSSIAGNSILFGEVTPKFITAADEQTYQGEAKHGCYMPIYINDDDRPLMPAAYRPLHATSDNNVDGTIDISQLSVTLNFKFELTTVSGESTFRIFDTDGNQLHSGAITTNTSTYTSTGYAFDDLAIPDGATIGINLYHSEAGGDPGGPKSIVAFTKGTTLLWIRNTNNADGSAVAFSVAATTPTVDAGFTLNNEQTDMTATYALDNSGEVSYKIYSINQNTGTIWYQAIAGSASVRVKGRMYVEAEAQPGSAWVGFNQPGAVDDESALHIAAQVAKRMPHGFRASCNENGILSKLLSGLLKRVPVVGDFLSTLV